MWRSWERAYVAKRVHEETYGAEMSIACVGDNMEIPEMMDLQSLGWEGIPWRREKLPTPVFWPGEFRKLPTSIVS